MSGRAPLRVAVVTNVLPHYRAALYRSLFQRNDLELHVYCQRSIPGMNLQTVHEEFGDRITLVPAWTMPREALSWQWLPWRRLLTSYDVIFVIGNVRILSAVVLATLARILGKPVVLWGQAHTANANRRAERIRLGWWRWFRHFLVYTDAEVRRLEADGFRGRDVIGMNNGLDQRAIDAAAVAWDSTRLEGWRADEGLAGRRIVLSCARLEPKNRYDLWIQALPEVIAERPDLLWCAIGEGRERAALEAMVEQAGLSAHVRWLGPILEESMLAPWFLSAEWLVHPGAIGLTLLHAFGYGLPVVTHDDPEGHMPEFDAFARAETGLLFRRGDPRSLARTMLEALSDPAGRTRMSARARQIARESYNVEVMSRRFAQAAERAAGRDLGLTGTSS